ncbi:MAG TPA: hypothetical protein VFP12_09590 [Allosphingosinicella sp.]|nr:hypothetical protein [Allosphingosinicella sp.]
MKTKFLTATALVLSSFSPVLITPAFAVTSEAQADLQAACEAFLNPDDAAEFNTEPTSVSEVTGAEFLSDSDVLSSTPGGVLLSQTSVYNANSQHRHGGSPNIFGGFTVTSVYTGGSSETLNTYSATTTYTFGCRVWKDLPNGNTIEPNGLQIEATQTLDETLVTRTETVTVNNPNETVVTAGDGVICISPNKNPGTWRNQNGYTGACNTTLFYSLAGIPDPIPSNSLPPA